jgi:hypothetical protein
MVAKTSGTTAFNLDLAEIVEEAYERTGQELRTGYELRTARRSLNIMLAEWANRGINLWTIEQGTLAMVAGSGTYDLPADTIDLLDHVLRTGTGTGQSDVTIERISASTYAQIPSKNVTGRPTQVWINRRSGAANSASIVQYPQINVWPVPDVSSTYTFVYWRMRRMQDMAAGAGGADVPYRFLPALVSGLAFYLSLKSPSPDAARTVGLKQMYEEEWLRAAEEDRDKTSLRLVPG